MTKTGSKTTVTNRYEYGLVMCIFMGCVFAYVIVLTFVGPEYLKRSFEVREDSDMDEAAGHDTIEAALQRIHERNAAGVTHSDPEDVGIEKGVATEHA